MFQNDKKIKNIEIAADEYVKSMTLYDLFNNEYTKEDVKVLDMISSYINVNRKIKDLNCNDIRIIDKIFKENTQYATFGNFINKIKKEAIIKRFNELKY